MGSSPGDPVSSTVSSTAPVAAIAALELERSILARSFRANATAPNAARLVIYCSGPGPERAALAARQAIDAGVSALLSFGLAGGLRAGMSTGAVILPQRIVDATGGWDCDTAWTARIAAALASEPPAAHGVLVSVDHVATSVAEKRALAERHDAAAVDMESAAIARTAASAGIPFAAVRVVADGPNDALPANVERLVTAKGGTHLPALLGFIVKPGDFPALIRLGRRSHRARSVLARVAAALARADTASALLSAPETPSEPPASPPRGSATRHSQVSP